MILLRMDDYMGVVDKLETTLPAGIDKDSSDKVKWEQTVKALSEEFRVSVRSKGVYGKTIDEIIAELTVKDVNDLLFDDPVPNVPGGHYCSIIDEFLSTPDAYKDKWQPILDGYLSTVSDLQKRVQALLYGGHTREDDENNRTSTATYLDTRLTSICERTKLVAYVYQSMDNLQENTITVKDDVRKLSKKVSDIDNTSDKIMPNIVTLLGVFSSIIIVILTLITTSSTWLSNANEVSVLIAFVVPAAIATLTICALTAFIRTFMDNVSETSGTQSQDKDKRGAIKQTFNRWGLWFSVAAIALLVVFGTMWFCQKEEDNQSHYIVKCVPMSETIDHSNGATVQPSSETSSPELFIIYEVILPTGEIYPEKIPCGESDKHEDGYVYYCLLHERFE